MSSCIAGQVIGREYRLERPIGAGGMGEVWLAAHLGTGRPRALKIMSAALGLDARACERFVEEARVGARIASEHVVEVVGVGIDSPSGMPWLAMELLEGEDLAHAIAQRGALGSAEVALILEQVGHGLGAAHDVGIVHRDLKPENLFLAHPRRVGAGTMVKILDFGIAAILPDDRSKATVTSALGTPLWWSPEQMQVGEHVSAATDVWPLGLIAFFALTGRYYWQTPYAADVSVARIVTEILVDPLPLASVRARELGVSLALPAGFDAWFGSCVVRDPKARFRDARAAVAALLPVLRGARRPHAASVAFAATLVTPVAAPVVAPRAALVVTPVEPPSPRSRALVFGLVLFALGVLGVLGALSLRLTREVRPPPRLAVAGADAAILDGGVVLLAEVVEPPDPTLAVHEAPPLVRPSRVLSGAPAPHAPSPAPSPSAPAPVLAPPNEPAVAPPIEPAIEPALESPPLIELHRGTSTASFGNPTGGDPHEDLCGSGEALVGLEGNSIPHVGRIRAVCGRLVSPASPGPIAIRGPRSLAEHGRLGDPPTRALCPSDHVVVGFDARSGLLVDRITLRCAPLEVDASGRVVVGAAVSGRSIGGSGGHPSGTTSCGASEVARGARIRAGDSVDAFGLACGELSIR